jgi:hypothetical protein
MPRRAARPLAVVAAAAVALAAGIPAAAHAGTTTTPTTPTTPTTTTPITPTAGVDTVDIHNCSVKRSRNAGGFTWFACSITASVPAGQTASVRYTANFASFTPNKNQAGPDWSKSTGKISVGAGDTLAAIKVAVKNRNLTAGQVRNRLKVTLSQPQGITIGDGTATATGATASAAGLISPPPAASSQVTVDIHNCNVRASRNAGGFTWASCTITWTGPQVKNGSVKWSSNLATFTPNPNQAGSDWRPRTGTMAISGGDGIWGVKLAFKKPLTVAQVKSRLKVTLSSPKNVVIGDATATAVGS